MHKLEPWVFSPHRRDMDYIIHTAKADPNAPVHGIPDDEGVIGSSEWTWLSEDDAERIILCINALADVSNDMVEQVVSLGKKALEDNDI